MSLRDEAALVASRPDDDFFAAVAAALTSLKVSEKVPSTVTGSYDGPIFTGAPAEAVTYLRWIIQEDLKLLLSDDISFEYMLVHEIDSPNMLSVLCRLFGDPSLGSIYYGWHLFQTGENTTQIWGPIPGEDDSDEEED